MRIRTKLLAAVGVTALIAATAAVVLGGTEAALSAPPETNAAPEAAVAGLAAALKISPDAARRQLLAQDKAHRVAAKLPDGLAPYTAGKWFNAESGQLVVAVTSRSAAAQVTAAGAQPQFVSRSQADLDRLLNAVKAVVAQGVPAIYSWGFDVRDNDVKVHVNASKRTAATDAALAKLRALGPGVQIVETKSQQRQQGGEIRTGNPWWPGTESNCSVGFPVTDSSGGKHILTAGHCTNDANQPAYGQQGQLNKIGTSNVGGTHSVNAREGDMGVVAVTEPNWTLSPLVNTWGQPAITVSGSVDALVGDAVCHSGNTSHWQCGVVKYTHKSVDYGGGLVIEDLTWTTACSLGGDSGGGWLVGTKAAGLHDGGPSQCVSNPSDDDLSLFQPVNEALQKWNLTLVTDGGDPTPPSAPGNARSTGATATTVSLAWDASTDNVGVTAYDVYNGSTLATTATATSATVSGLTPDTAYSFTVKARDAAGNVSAASNVVSARTQPGGGGDDEPPTTPGNPRSTDQTTTSISLAWDASVDNVGVTAYDVYNGSALATTATATTATVTGLTADTQYSFTIQARDAAGNKSKATVPISVRTKPSGGGRTFTNTADFPIFDFQQFYSPISSTATGPAATTVTLVINIQHTCAEDLGISLFAPNGTAYPVKYSGGYTCTAWNGPRTFTVPGINSPAAGTWRVRVTDYGPGDTGFLDSWSITL